MLTNWIEKILELLGGRKQLENPPAQQEVTPIEIDSSKVESIQVGEKTEEHVLESSYLTPINFPVGIKTERDVDVVYVEVIRDDKGAVEDYFFDSIRERFEDKIKNNICIILPDFDVTPDLAYIDSEKDLFIAIEIDEPYTSNSDGNFIPIHYRGLDDERNKALLANGWSILRFAEIQIVRSTKECERFISSFVNSEPNGAGELANTPTWTKDDALKMIEGKFRNTYLPFNFQEGIRTNSKFSYRRFKLDFMSKVVSAKGGFDVVLNLYLQKKYSGDTLQIIGDYQCYIPEEIFWKNYSEDIVGKIIYKEHNLKSKNTALAADMLIGPAYFEAVGYSNGRYFNLLDKSKFKIIHLPQVVELAQKYGTSKTYRQITDEVIKSKKEAASLL